MSISETMRRIEFLLEKHCPKNALLFDMSEAILATPKTQGRRRELTQSQKNEIMRLRTAGYTYDEIARAIDSTATVVCRTVHGITRRTKVLDPRRSERPAEAAGFRSTYGRPLRGAHV